MSCQKIIVVIWTFKIVFDEKAVGKPYLSVGQHIVLVERGCTDLRTSCDVLWCYGMFWGGMRKLRHSGQKVLPACTCGSHVHPSMWGFAWDGLKYEKGFSDTECGVGEVGDYDEQFEEYFGIVPWGHVRLAAVLCAYCLRGNHHSVTLAGGSGR